MGNQGNQRHFLLDITFNLLQSAFHVFGPIWKLEEFFCRPDTSRTIRDNLWSLNISIENTKIISDLSTIHDLSTKIICDLSTIHNLNTKIIYVSIRLSSWIIMAMTKLVAYCVQKESLAQIVKLVDLRHISPKKIYIYND